MNVILTLTILVTALSSLNDAKKKNQTEPIKLAARAAGDFIVGRCVDCANNKANYQDKKKKDEAQTCIKAKKGLVCKQDGLSWVCAEGDLVKRQCHRSYTFELWCNEKDPENVYCDGKMQYVPEGGDGRIPGPNGSFVGPDGKFNWFDPKLILGIKIP